MASPPHEAQETNSTRTGRLEGARPLAAAEELGHRLPTLVAVVLGQLVHVHADEAVGEPGLEPAPELERVLERFLARRRARPRIDSRRTSDSVAERLLAQIPPRDVDPERQRQPGLEEPPLAQVDDRSETVPART